MENRYCIVCLALLVIFHSSCNRRHSTADNSGSTAHPISTVGHVTKPIESAHQRLIRIAIAEIGVKEESENYGKRVGEYLASPGSDIKYAAYWCAAYTNWVHWKAGAKHPLKGAAFCPNWFIKERTYWKAGDPIAKIRLATEAGYYFKNLGRIGHIGIINAIDYDLLTVSVIEGNAKKDAHSRNGTMVVCKQRQIWEFNKLADWTK